MPACSIASRRSVSEPPPGLLLSASAATLCAGALACHMSRVSGSTSGMVGSASSWSARRSARAVVVSGPVYLYGVGGGVGVGVRVCVRGEVGTASWVVC
jgi:hypothetical protein